jgi:hypothetical protein
MLGGFRIDLENHAAAKAADASVLNVSFGKV